MHPERPGSPVRAAPGGGFLPGWAQGVPEGGPCRFFPRRLFARSDVRSGGQCAEAGVTRASAGSGYFT